MDWKRATIFSIIPTLVLAAALLCLSACSPPSPEEQIRSMVQRAEKAAKERDLGAFKALIAEDYSDREGRTRRDLLGLLAWHFRTRERVFVLTRITRLTFPAPGKAELTLVAALAGSEVNSPNDLSQISADLHRLTLELGQKGNRDWEVRSAAWERAEVGEFLGGTGERER